MKLAICEDNPSHYEIIHTILQKYPPGAFEITHFASGDEFLRAVAENGCPYPIVLTDIDLGSDTVNGISLAEKINHISPDTQIIFISQHLKYASSVYETNHVYFVYKQQMAEYLPKALSAACQKIYNLREQYFCFSYHSRDYRILRSDVLYMERKLRNTEIHTKSQIYYCCEKIQDLLEQLKPDFCICHKSFAVNINAIHTFSHAGIELSDGTHLPVSRNCYQSTKDSFAQLLLKN